MKMIKTLALTGLCLIGTAVSASEEKYPAWDFQPSVIFSNPELIEKTSGALATTPSAGTTAPASGGVAAAVPQQAAVAAPHEADPKYPAAYFNPQLLYPAN